MVCCTSQAHVVMEKLGLWMETYQQRDEWRCASTTHGVLCVMTPETTVMHVQSAGSWDCPIRVRTFKNIYLFPHCKCKPLSWWRFPVYYFLWQNASLQKLGKGLGKRLVVFLDIRWPHRAEYACPLIPLMCESFSRNITKVVQSSITDIVVIGLGELCSKFPVLCVNPICMLLSVMYYSNSQ